ncbi:hypothetical protein SERLA73DRAFT_70628 [Serpula lacrymans var. lacrymans S7.3]|uniref:Uncharacterized protein n=2 Tax=Serpula lacrymans var. lacrymans TaxID=341189 RepID=F8PPS5_SERL3|nr:uncharacterized protein SERLADRAFT_434871 [Serpula lacrymans var. lacrymans S7.9]EGO01442.1 hypothetical protein SERLA73DRAFT_70628 [Serpula lacrymans var. lacrymans S7.3]EGO27104.1 hypothetical protein SERLADRAFT_434871 [Serpula lacrymans var. lacrymans S7.9]
MAALVETGFIWFCQCSHTEFHHSCLCSFAAEPARAHRPSTEPRPGAFVFTTEVVDGEAKRDFSTVTDMEWDKFYSEVAKLIKDHSKEDQLAYKVSGDTGKPLYMNNEHNFKAAMERVANKANVTLGVYKPGNKGVSSNKAVSDKPVYGWV